MKNITLCTFRAFWDALAIWQKSTHIPFSRLEETGLKRVGENHERNSELQLMLPLEFQRLEYFFRLAFKPDNAGARIRRR